MDASTWSASSAAFFGTMVAIWHGWNWESRQRLEKQHKEKQEIAEKAEQRKEEQRLHRLKMLEDTYILRPKDDNWKRADGHGQIGILFAGTYAARRAPHVLNTFVYAGATSVIGGIFLVELDQTELDLCLKNIPKVFMDRVTIVKCHSLTVGGGGKSMQRVEDLKDQWWSDVFKATEEWLSYIERTDEHGMLLAFASPGGMAAFGRAVMKVYRNHYPKMPVYLVTLIDDKTVVRKRFPELRAAYVDSGLVDGMIVTYNLRYAEASDEGIDNLFGAMVSGAWTGDTPLHIWNALAYLFDPDSAVRYATLSVRSDTVPVYHLGADDVGGEVYYTKTSILENKVNRCIKEVASNFKIQSVPIEPAPQGQTRLLYVILPVVPEPDLAEIKQRTTTNLEEWRAKFIDDIDLRINFSSVGGEITTDTQNVRITVVLVQPLADDGTQLDALSQGTLQIDPKFLTEVPAPSLPALPNHKGPGRPPKQP